MTETSAGQRACDLCKNAVASGEELVRLLRFRLCAACLGKPISALKELSDQAEERIDADLARLARRQGT